MPNRTGIYVYAALVVLTIIVIAVLIVRQQHSSETFDTAEGRPLPPGSVSWEGAGRHIRDLKVPNDGFGMVMVGGYIDAYDSRLKKQPCGHMPIESPIPYNTRNLDWIEDALSISCGYNVRAQWFVVNVWLAKSHSADKEGFFCWGGENSRENYRGGRKGRWALNVAEGFAGTDTVLDSCNACRERFCSNGQCFSPDEPGACASARNPRSGANLAADIERQGIMVADGVV